jgi:hypothetical protein
VKIQSNGHEHEFEAAYGLPEPLPKGEKILWQGAPDFADLAVRVFHLEKIALYFAVLMAVRASFLYSTNEPYLTVLAGALMVAGLGLTAMVALTILAWLTSRTTAYTLTDQRVVMRIGIVLTLTFNLPFKRIETAGLQLTTKGFGDIPLVLSGGDRIGWLNLWPHVRPWRVAQPQPMLRCVPNAQAVAATFQQAWASATHNPLTPSAPSIPETQSATWHAGQHLTSKPI